MPDPEPHVVDEISSDKTSAELTKNGARRDGDELVVIVAYPDGPFLVRGPIDLVAPDGETIPRDRRTIALCRCGKSVIKPFCDGTHKIIGFKTEAEPRDQ